MLKQLPKLAKDGFTIRDGVQANKENPETFWIPSDEDKAKLKPGNLVKLSFDIQTIDEKGELEINGERMWVIILEINKDLFTGILDNQPQCTNELKPGYKLHFKPKHIIDISDFEVDIKEEKFQKYLEDVQKLYPNQG